MLVWSLAGSFIQKEFGEINLSGGVDLNGGMCVWEREV